MERLPRQTCIPKRLWLWRRAADRVAAVAALVTEAGAPLVLTSADKRAIRGCEADPALIAEAFTAAARGEWGGDFLHQNLSARLVIQRLSGYLAWKSSLADGRPVQRPQRVIGNVGTRREERVGPAASGYDRDPWARPAAADRCWGIAAATASSGSATSSAFSNGRSPTAAGSHRVPRPAPATPPLRLH